MIKFLSLFLCLSVGFSLSHAQPAQESASEPAKITEWKVPWENTRPRDPYVAPDGSVWFVGQQGGYVARFDIETERFDRFELGDQAGPHNLIVDEEGFVWFAGNRNAYIGRLNPEDGSIKRYDMPDSRARDPHTLVFDQAGDIWFTVQGGNFVGKLATQNGKITLLEVPTSRARPYGIVVDQSNRPWIALFGTNKLATVDPKTMKLREIELEHEEARPRRLALTNDGMLWYGDYARGFIGRYNPNDDTFKEWALPSGASSSPYAMASDHQGRIWLVETGVDPNQFVGFNPQNEQFFSTTSIESGGGTVRHMVFHEPTKSVWFGTDTNYLGKAAL